MNQFSASDFSIESVLKTMREARERFTRRDHVIDIYVMTDTMKDRLRDATVSKRVEAREALRTQRSCYGIQIES